MKFAKSLEKLSLVLVAITALTFASGQAMADQFNFTFAGATAFGSGTLTATSNGDGTFTAISGTGTESVSGITDSISLIFNPNGTSFAVSPSGNFTFDNQIFPGNDPLLDNSGLLFQSSTQEINLYSNGPGSYQYYQQSGFNEVTNFTLTAAAVPEPTTALLLGVGFVGLAAVRRKRLKKHA